MNRTLRLDAPVESGLITLPIEIFGRIAREASSKGMRLASHQCKQVSDLFADKFSTQLTVLMPTADDPQPTTNMAQLNNVMGKMPNISQLRVLLNFPPFSYAAAINFGEIYADASVQVLGFRDVLAAQAPSITNLSMLQTGYRVREDAELFHNFFSPFATDLSSLTLDINLFFYTAANFLPFKSLQLLKGNAFRNRVQDIDFVQSLPQLRNLTICTQSTSPAAFAAMPSIECVNLKVVDSTRSRSNEGLDGINKLTAVVQLHIDYSAADPKSIDVMPHTAAIQNISQLDTLRCLTITWDSVLDLSSLCSLVNLEKFSVDCLVPTNFDCISSMPALTHLHVESKHHSVKLSTAPLDLSKNRMLQELIVRDREVSAGEIDEIAALPFLTRLDLCRSWGLSKKKILPLAALTGLLYLRLSHTHVPIAAQRTLLKAMTELKMLDVRGCNPNTGASFGQLPDLTERIPSRVFITEY